jgi:NADPH:quinone reductase-like Zn-dependent oxidoreductase
MAPQTQKALVVTEVGKPLTLTTDRATPQPGAGQVLIHVTVAGPNPHDQKARDGGLFIAESLPAVLTNDVVGEVVTLGPGVTKYAVGDHIVGQATFDKTFTQSGLQEYAVLDVDHSAKIPEGFTDDDGATLPTNVIAPLVALFDAGTLGIPAPWTDAAKNFDFKGTTLLVVGGGSNCGRLGVQLAAIAGIGRIVVVGGDEAELKSYGATDVIDRHGSPEEVTKRIRDVVGDDLIYAYDAINPPPTQTIAINALSSTKKGKLARLLPTGPIDESKVHAKKEGYEVKNVFGSSQVRADLCKPFWEHLPQYLKEGKLKPTKYEVVSLKGWEAEKVNEVLDRYRDGKKVVKTHFHLLE